MKGILPKLSGGEGFVAAFAALEEANGYGADSDLVKEVTELRDDMNRRAALKLADESEIGLADYNTPYAPVLESDKDNIIAQYSKGRELNLLFTLFPKKASKDLHAIIKKSFGEDKIHALLALWGNGEYNIVGRPFGESSLGDFKEIEYSFSPATMKFIQACKEDDTFRDLR